MVCDFILSILWRQDAHSEPVISLAKRLPVGECLPVCTHTMEATNPVSTPGVSTSKFWASYGIPPPLTPQENANPTLFNVGSCPPTKRPNRSQESKDKTAAKRALATRAVKVWEALKYHMDKGVDIMSDIDDIAGLHAYIGAAEGKADMVHARAHLGTTTA